MIKKIIAFSLIIITLPISAMEKPLPPKKRPPLTTQETKEKKAKIPELQAGYSIKYYLENKPEEITGRLKGDSA